MGSSRELSAFTMSLAPGSALPHLLDGHRKLVGCSAIPARSCLGFSNYVELINPTFRDAGGVD